jgi:hypothetical protein
VSQGWIETRIFAVEQRVEWLIRLVQDLIPQLRNATQAARTASAGYGDGGGGGGGGAFFCMPSGTVAGATGTWPALTPTSFTADVYTVAGGTMTLAAASATCWNYFPAGLVSSQVVALLADGTGNFDAIAQSCV